MPEGLLKDNIQELADVVEASIQAGIRKFEVDATQMRAITSGALGGFAEILMEVKKAGGEMFMVGLNEQVERLFCLTHLDDLFVAA